MTYEFEVTYKKGGEQSYLSVRARDKIDAILEANKLLGEIIIINVSRIGN